MRLGPCAVGRLGKRWSVSLPAPLPTAEAYVGGMLFCLGIFLSFYLLTVLLACWENWRYSGTAGPSPAPGKWPGQI